MHHRIVSVVETVEFVTGRMSGCLRDRWINIIVLIVPAPSEEKSDDPKDSFYGEM